MRAILPSILTIAGSESTGGAGVQVDLRVFAKLGVYGCAALTLVVAFDPNNNWAHRVYPLPKDALIAQIEAAVAAHPELDTIKIGMLGSVDTIQTVSEILDQNSWKVVLDPVMICKGQDSSHSKDVDQALQDLIVPKATLITPNLFELCALVGAELQDVQTEEHLRQLAYALHAKMEIPYVYAKMGADTPGPYAVDVLISESKTDYFSALKDPSGKIAGAGCTLASAIAGYMSLGLHPIDAARKAKEFTTRSIFNKKITSAPFPSANCTAI